MLKLMKNPWWSWERSTPVFMWSIDVRRFVPPTDRVEVRS
jgi:hypothetical protein